MTTTARALSEPSRTTIQVPGSGDAPAADLVTGFRNGFVFELLDVRETQPIAVHVLVLNPDKYELTEPHQSVLTPTAANRVVDESTGIIQRTLSLEGTFGVAQRRATAFERAQGNGALLSGHEHFKALRDMFRQYSALKQDANSAAYVRMIFHALRDDDHFVLAQPTFTTPRDVRSARMHYRYRIQASAIGDAREISKLRRSNIAARSNFFDNALRAVAQAFNDARAAFAEVNSQLFAVRRKLGNINAVMVQAAQFINAVGNAIKNGADTLIAYPIKLAASVVTQIADAADFLADSIVSAKVDTERSIVRSFQRLEDAFDRILAFPERFEAARESPLRAYLGERRLTAQDIEDGTAGATIGTTTRVRSGSESESTSFGDYRGVQAVRVTATDSIETFATRYSVDPELIVLINDLRAPYILPGGGPGLLQAGDEILIPLASGGGTGGQPSGDYVGVDDALYGVDLAIDMDRLNRDGVLDLRAPVRAQAGDADLSRGVPNVVQGTAITIWTERGATSFLPDVGVSRNVGMKGTVQHVMLASLNIRDALLADSRIVGIAESSIVLDGDVLTQEIVPIVAGRRDNTTIVLPFGTVSGSE